MTVEPGEIPIDDASGVEERPQNRREWSGAARSLVLPLLIVATIVGVLWYIDRARGGGAASDGRYGIVALPDGMNTTGKPPSSDVGRAAPDFLLQTPEGQELRLSDFRGKPVLVNFWASWCQPCRQEMPEIVKAAGQRQGDGLIVIAVDLQEGNGQIRDFAREFGMQFPIVVDRSGQVADSWRIGGPVQGIPSSYFVDRDGIVRARVFGPMDAQRIADELKTVLE